MRNSHIGQAWLVLALAVGFGAALAGVETWLKPKIDANKRAMILNELPNLVPDADAAASAKEAPLTITVGTGREQRQYDVYRAMGTEGDQRGWVIRASGKGFADKIELLIGVNLRATIITGLSILDQKETPGLGNKIEEFGDEDHRGFLWQFYFYEFPTTEPLVVTTASPTKDQKNKVKAVAGATISSRSVCNIINDALSKELRQKLVAASGPSSAPTEPAKE